MPINNDMLHVTNEKKIKLTLGSKFDLVSHKIAMLMDKDAWMEVMVRSDRRFGKSWTCYRIMSQYLGFLFKNINS